MNRLQQIEARIDRKLRDVLRSSSTDQRRELVEVHRAILEDIAAHVDTLPRGKRAFSYSHVDVQVLVAEPERRRSYELVFLEKDSLLRDIETYFEEHRIEFPASLKVNVELVDTLAPDQNARGFEVTYSHAPASSLSHQNCEVRLTILSGKAEHSQYAFKQKRINLGRLAEVLDSDLRIVRRNDVAFVDEAAGANASVSRAHAHIEFDPETTRYRLFDDRSAHGTTVIRGGSVIPVPQGISKGVPLHPGDELILGQAHILFDYPET